MSLLKMYPNYLQNGGSVCWRTDGDRTDNATQRLPVFILKKLTVFQLVSEPQ